MTLNSKTVAALVVSILFGGILLSSALGWWQTESNKIAATFTDGEFAGKANPADIRGSYTFGDVEKNFGVSAAILGQAFNVSADPAAFQVKNLEGTVTESGEEIGTASVRLFVAFYQNLPFDLSTDIYLPEPAAELLQSRTLTPERVTYLAAHTVSLVSAPQPASIPQTESTPAPATTDRTLKGKTTFGEVLSWGVSQAAIEQVLGMPMPSAPSTTLKDFCTTNSLNFETIKPAMQAEVDKIK